MVLTYLHFRILEFPLMEFVIVLMKYSKPTKKPGKSARSWQFFLRDSRQIRFDPKLGCQKNGRCYIITLIWVCLKIGYTPNEIAIFHRDNDQQNHWVWDIHYFQTQPYTITWKKLRGRWNAGHPSPGSAASILPARNDSQKPFGTCLQSTLAAKWVMFIFTECVYVYIQIHCLSIHICITQINAIILYHNILYHIMSDYIILYHIICYVMFCFVLFCYVMLCCVIYIVICIHITINTCMSCRV